ncbi:LacI family DNA-binding transcriptional regulator [Actinophytocola gossypii]|uniref:LacI family DNA-binding transcriptional regulator n=1 Tax=Actinophytocola gossypii TaxID=2812003 RepID=A0ABT2J9H5_9PSEU|nr:LacI family DNA-binding transcriptional regulator [Actinophytocola gossypii]MCT2584224.1 LacI family DNA-binding transcriptional regulator [Actinophytocola gossypii]
MSDSAPTLEDVARVAGVSRATVSRVINGIRNVDTEIQKVVRRAIEETGYAPNRAARSLVTRRTGAVALVVSGAGEPAEHVFGDPFFGRVVAGVVAVLRRHGSHPLLMLADTADARADVLAHLRQGGADGALLVSTLAEDPLPGMCVRAGVPAVLFARPNPPVPISYVDVAHRAGAALAADHLRARGCERLGTISGPLDVPASRERLDGFRDALRGHGPVPNEPGNFTHASGETAMARLLAAHPDLDGVFAANDLMAQGALGVLHREGRRVPDDVALVGFDDSSPARSCRPALTTVRQPVEDMGAELARLLLAHIDEPARPSVSVVFDPTLVVRESA